MGHIVGIDAEGRVVYEGFLSSKEKALYDEVLNTLKDEIPQIEDDLAERYGDGVKYKYFLGQILANLLDRFNVSVAERRKFWDEIKNFATQKKRKRNEGTNSKTRSFYEQCFILSQIDLDVVEKLSWRQWQDLLDRVGNREDSRIYAWIKAQQKKIREDDWREFEKALNVYLRGKDTCVFTDSELFGIYDTIMLMSVNWRLLFNEFKKKHPKSAKIKTKSGWAKKYYTKCFELRKAKKRQIDKELCKEVFQSLMEKERLIQ
ncbi:MAG: ATP-dependent helicase [Clostridiales bacterium]|nr:ATP-dependent helicase [Clostridiales bacterium]